MRGLFISRPRPPLRAQGISLVELLAIIGVTLVMGAVAVSAYRTYSIRAQIAAGIAGAAGIQAHVARAFKRDGSPPRDRHATGLVDDPVNEVATYIESVEVIDGRIELRYGRGADEALAGSVLSLTPFETADLDVVWVCGNRQPGVGLKPLGFMAGSRHATQVLTAIDDRYLPSNCR